MHWTVRFVLATAMTVVSAVAYAQDIKIATVGPMTGADAAVGEQFRRGAEMAVKDINAHGGVLGRKLALTVGDDACDPKQAVSVANQLANAGVVFVAGHYCSSTSIPASAVYADANILQITPASTNPALTDDATAKGWINVFRVCGRDDSQGKVAGDYIAARFKGKAVAVIDDKSTYGKGLADQTIKEMAVHGIKPAVHDSINAGDSDFSAIISKMKAANVRAIYFGGYFREAGLIVRQAKEQGLNAVLMGGDALVTTDLWKITGEAGTGTLMTFPPDPRGLASARAVVKEFKASGYDPEGYTLYTYAAIQVFAEAAKKAHSIKMADLSKTMKANKFKTVIGTVGFNAKGDVIGPDYVVYSWKNGQYAELKH
ncbi:MAG: branched-chain amino acid ABC transporter substrate-binding protein [Alphaproteobacteria bacterium]|nr:branched-chain amino acid ABC transporter substrate-binding protein [Alphaproteobacteria bacterium]